MLSAIRRMGAVMIPKPILRPHGSRRTQSTLRVGFEKQPPFKQPEAGFRIPHVTDCVNVKFMGSKGEELLSFDSSRVRRSVNFAWNEFNTETAYQPKLPSLESFELTQKEVDALTSYFALANQSKTFQEGKFKYLFDAHKFQTQTVVSAIESCIRQYLECDAPYQEKVQAQELHNMLINLGWLEKFVMFSDIKQTKKAQSFVPEIVSKPYLILSNLFGNHPEFTYYGHYVGATCANMSDRQQALKDVDFDTPQSIVDWLNEFKPLYSFETPENKERFQAEKYFRFIHLAMEMVYSQEAVSIHNLLTTATKEPDPKRKSSLIKDALTLVNKVEVNQNKVFKTLPLGSDPKLYNEFVRPYIASTWGGNNGTVYDERGKFFEGCIKTGKAPDLYAVGQPEVGVFKQHVGQTGAGTTVRPICDEFSGGVSDVYNQEFPEDLMWSVMTDESKMIKEIERGYDPLSFMLLLFRAISRPFSHNQQIQKAKQVMAELQPFINENPELLVCQLKNQVMAMVHRLDHYYYVHRYIHKEPQATAQKRTVATGGTRTTDFLPALIKTNHEKAVVLLNRLESEISRLEPIKKGEYTKQISVIETQLEDLIKKITVLMKTAKKVEATDDQ